MTVILHDAEHEAHHVVPSPSAYINVSDILYADDTMLVHDDQDALQDFLNVIVAVGARYGLEMHWGKVELLRVPRQGREAAHAGSGKVPTTPPIPSPPQHL